MSDHIPAELRCEQPESDRPAMAGSYLKRSVGTPDLLTPRLCGQERALALSGVHQIT